MSEAEALTVIAEELEVIRNGIGGCWLTLIVILLAVMWRRQ